MKYILCFALLFASIAASARSSVPVNNAGIPTLPFLENQNTYMLGLIAGGYRLYTDKKYTVIRFQPYRTPLLYTEDVLFCGDVTDKLIDYQGKFIIATYERVAHDSAGRIGCHELKEIMEVK